MQPLCKKCYEKMPLELKKRLKKAEQGQSPAKAKKNAKSK